MANEKAFLAMFVGYGAGLWGAWSASARTLAPNEARHWPSVRGKILESVTCQDPGGKHTHFRVSYEFTVGDRIEGHTPRLSGDWFWNNDAQADFVARYVR